MQLESFEISEDFVVVLAGRGKAGAQWQALVAEEHRQRRDTRLRAIGKRERDHAAGIEMRIVEERRGRLDAREGQPALLADALELGDRMFPQQLRHEWNQRRTRARALVVVAIGGIGALPRAQSAGGELPLP